MKTIKIDGQDVVVAEGANTSPHFMHSSGSGPADHYTEFRKTKRSFIDRRPTIAGDWTCLVPVDSGRRLLPAHPEGFDPERFGTDTADIFQAAQG